MITVTLDLIQLGNVYFSTVNCCEVLLCYVKLGNFMFCWVVLSIVKFILNKEVDKNELYGSN